MHYLALLRGINVGTNGRIRMDELKRLLEDAGFCKVATYIQSGNVFFHSDLAEDAARATIERALKEGASIATTAIVRTAEELTQIIRNCPFSAQEIAHAQAINTEGESLYVCLLSKIPDERAFDALSTIELGNDAYVVRGREVYLLLSQSIRNSKLAIRLQKLIPGMTVRNWNTMEKLLALSQALAE